MATLIRGYKWLRCCSSFEFWERWEAEAEAERLRHKSPDTPGGRLPPSETKEYTSHRTTTEEKPLRNSAQFTDPLRSTGAPKITTDGTLNAVSDGLVVNLLRRSPLVEVEDLLVFWVFFCVSRAEGLTCCMFRSDEGLVSAMRWWSRSAARARCRSPDLS